MEAGACRALESPPPCCPPLDKVSFLFTSATIGIIVRSSCPSPHGRIDGWELGQPKGDKGGEGMRLIDCSVEALDTGGGAAVVGEKGRRWRRGTRLGRESHGQSRANATGVRFAVITGGVNWSSSDEGKRVGEV